jgi:malonate transporter MadL subunit
VALHVKANVGGVGIAMLLLIAAKAWLARQGKLTPACAWAWNSGP